MTAEPSGPLRVLISAYACNPDEGSEPQTGWSIASSLALAGHHVAVLTRANNRAAIERAISTTFGQEPLDPPSFEYLDLSQTLLRAKKRLGLLRLYYYLWQIKAGTVARRLVRETSFDVGLHITLGSCWFPSSLSRLSMPFVWGPIGGGEKMPWPFVLSLGLRGVLFEIGRGAGKLRGRLDPFVRSTARRSTLALGATPETVAQLRKLGCSQVDLLPRMSLSGTELGELQKLAPPQDSAIRFMCIGRLLYWKGFHLALRAFAAAGIPNSTLWIIGNGPAGSRLRTLAAQLGIEDRVTFLGKLTRSETLAKLGTAHALIHPSLHDSGSWVAAEAMAAGRPIICLNLGGPGIIVSDEAGYRIAPSNPRQAVADIAQAMRELAGDGDKRLAMGRAGQLRVATHFTWQARGTLIAAALRDAVERGATPSEDPGSSRISPA